MLKERYFVVPASDLFTAKPAGSYAKKYRSYSHYNYLRPGLIARIKRHRFELALGMVSDRFGSTAAIDFGCADGILLPSLSRHFTSVTAVDNSPAFIEQSKALVAALGLSNVSIICNESMPFDQLRSMLPPVEHGVAFLLETLEHVGDAARLYESKMDFLHGVLSLLVPGGVVVVSVPKMVGYGFLLKYLTQLVLRLPTETMTWRDVYRSAVLRDTSGLEPLWNGSHLGFNQEKLERHLIGEFDVVKRLETLISAFYLVRER